MKKEFSNQLGGSADWKKIHREKVLGYSVGVLRKNIA